jgi:hypothetical protein
MLRTMDRTRVMCMIIFVKALTSIKYTDASTRPAAATRSNRMAVLLHRNMHKKRVSVKDGGETD